jgi:hypothetical protein
MTPSANRVRFRSPLFARRTIFLASNVAIAVSRSATFNRFRASSNAATHGRNVFGAECCFDFQKRHRHIARLRVTRKYLPSCRRTYRCRHEQQMNAGAVSSASIFENASFRVHQQMLNRRKRYPNFNKIAAFARQPSFRTLKDHAHFHFVFRVAPQSDGYVDPVDKAYSGSALVGAGLH